MMSPWHCKESLFEIFHKLWKILRRRTVSLRFEIFHNLWKIFQIVGIQLIKSLGVSNIGFRKSLGIRQFGSQITADGSIEACAILVLVYSFAKIFRIDFLKSKRAFLDNPLGTIDAQFGGDVVTVNADDGEDLDNLFVPASVVDFIETDYH